MLVPGRFAYDAAGERVAAWQRASGALLDMTVFLRDEAGRVLSDWQLIPGVSFGPKRDYLYAGDRLAVQLDWSEGESPVRQYIAVDHLNSTRAVVSDDGGDVTAEKIDYYPFGGFITGDPVPDTTHLFTGHERDTAEFASNLDYMHARYFSPILGRFLSVDPVGGEVGSSQSWNRYSYVLNNPLVMTDPDGEYGRGTGFTDKEWERFNKSQQRAAERMAKTAQKLEDKAGKLETKGKSGAGQLLATATLLRAGAQVLRSDGSDGFMAYSVDQSNYVSLGGDPDGAAGAYTCEFDMVVNRDHPSLSPQQPGYDYERILGHESLHSIGLRDERGSNLARAYRRGRPEQRAAYREISRTWKALVNPDHIMALVYP